LLGQKAKEEHASEQRDKSRLEHALAAFSPAHYLSLKFIPDLTYWQSNRGMEGEDWPGQQTDCQYFRCGPSMGFSKACAICFL